MLTYIHLQKCYASEYYAPLCHNRSGTLTYMPILNMTTSTNVPPRVQSTTTSEDAIRNLHSLPAKQYLSSMTPGTCGFLPPSSPMPIMAHTQSKSLVMDSTEVLMTTFGNVIQMLSNQTHPTLVMQQHLHVHQLLPPRQ